MPRTALPPCPSCPAPARLRAAFALPRAYVLAAVLAAVLTAALPMAFGTAPAQAQSWRDPVLGLEFVDVEGGCFEMGDIFRHGDEDERPVREVCVSDFAMAVREVTVGQYQRFAMETGRAGDAAEAGYCFARSGAGRMVRAAGRTWSQPGFVQDLTHPVVCVSAADAEAFAAWLSKKTGARLSLPTEAQWEYAARAGGRRMEYATYTGDIGRDQANMRGTHGPDEWTRTAPVGSFAPNPLGLYDMSGNVYEWVRDAYRPDAYKSAAFAAEGSNGSGDGAPHDPVVEGGGPRGKRGGSYALPEPYLRTANRGSNPLAADDIGFRLVRLP